MVTEQLEKDSLSNQLTLDESGVLLELLRAYARECESDYYEAHYAGEARKANRLKNRFETIDAFYDRFQEQIAREHGVSVDFIDDMRLEDVFEKSLIKEMFPPKKAKAKRNTCATTFGE